MGKILGVDGCPSGWTVVSTEKPPNVQEMRFSFQVFPTIKNLMTAIKDIDLLLIDIPIGMLSGERNSGGKNEFFTRPCDIEARKKLKWPRSSSIFNPPCREALYMEKYSAANELNKKLLGKGLSKQSWNISDKIRELDRFLQKYPEKNEIIKESHPEIVFWALNGKKPMQYNKAKKKGKAERMKVIENWSKRIGIRPIPNLNHIKKDLTDKGWDLATDDIFDAWILAIASYLIHTNPKNMRTVHPNSEIKADKKGLPMRIVYASGQLYCKKK